MALSLSEKQLEKLNKKKERSSAYRLKCRQEILKPLMEDYFQWVKEQIRDYSVPMKSETGQGLSYSVSQETYLRVFLDHGDIFLLIILPVKEQSALSV